MSMENKAKYTIIKEGGKEYILASEVMDYAKDYFKTSFGIPSYRTIRYYVTEGILDRPQKLGRETYFELEYITTMLDIIRRVNTFNPSLSYLKSITENIKKNKQEEKALEALEAACNSTRLTSRKKQQALLDELATKKPSDIRVSEIEDLIDYDLI